MKKALPCPLTTVVRSVKGQDGSLIEEKEKADMMQGPTITFIGGQQLTSTGKYEEVESDQSVAYPPGAKAPKIVPGELKLVA